MYNEIRMKTPVGSDYSACRNVSKGRHILVALIDYFTAVIFSFLLFGAVAMPVFFALPSTAPLISSMTDAGNDLSQIVADTRLQDYDAVNATFVDLDVSGKTYIRTLVKTSYYQNHETYYEVDSANQKVEKTIAVSETFFQENNGDYPNDRLAYFWITFVNQNGLRTAIQNRTSLNESMLLDTTNADLMTVSMDKPFCLPAPIAEKVLSYLNYSEPGSDGGALYNRILELYKTTVQTGITLVEGSYAPYTEKLSLLQNYTVKYAKEFTLVILGAYVAGFLITYVLFPLCFHNGRTIGDKVLGLALVRNDGGRPVFLNHLLRNLMLFLTNASVLFFLPLFIGKLSLLTYEIMGPVTLLQISLFAFFLGILSLILSLCAQDGQTLSELAAMSHLVAIHSHEEPVPQDNEDTHGKA